MQLSYYGQGCFTIDFGGKKLLFDPFISSNPLAQEAGIKADDIQADVILVSHAHFDHTEDLLSIASRTQAKVICCWEIHAWLNARGVTNTHPMNTGGKFNFDFGTVKCVSAVHSSSFGDGTYGGVAMGFVIYNQTEGSFYYAGDTALTLDMQLIPRTCPRLKFAILPIGDNFTMGYEDAAIASDFIHCNRIIGMHFDTFGYIKIDHKAAVQLFDAQAKSLYLPEVGKSFEIN